jgi:hypothetical protein
MKLGRPLALPVLASLFLGVNAHADDVRKQCADSYEKAQYLQREGKLSAERAELLVCARDACAAFVRTECAKWLGELDANQPTVIFALRDADGNDLTAVRVEVDGALLTETVGGNAFPIDPGEHTLRFSRAAGAPLEQRIVVRLTEKNRIVKAEFPRPVTAPAPVPAKAALPPPAPVSTRGSLAPALVVGGVALGALAVSIGLGVSAKADADDLRATCAPRCAPGSTDPIQTKLIVSDVLTGVGLVGLGVATVLFIVRPGKSSAPTVGFAPTWGGAAFSLHASF